MENFGAFLKAKREKLSLTVRDLALLTGIDFSLISKYESNSRKPTIQNLSKIKDALNLSEEDYFTAKKLGNYIDSRGGGEIIQMDNNQNQQVNLQVNMPNDLKVLYTDSTFFSINQYGVVLDFAQTVGATQQQNIVSRIGMSKEHAKILITKLLELLNNDNKLNQEPVTKSKSKQDVVN